MRGRWFAPQSQSREELPVPLPRTLFRTEVKPVRSIFPLRFPLRLEVQALCHLRLSRSTSRSGSSSSQTSTSASSTFTSASSALPRYGVITKRGTSEETFEEFIQQLDGGTSFKVTWPTLKTQIYLPRLTDAQAAELPMLYSFMKVVLHDGVGCDSYDN
jgi:hypothetical protein